MKVPYGWLKEFVPIRESAKGLSERLTLMGLEVEGIAEVAGEPVLEVNVTPNRGDCLSILGLAREVSALTGQPFRDPMKSSPKGTERRIKEFVSVVLQDRRGCPRYSLRVVTGLKVGPSPEWLVKRLSQVGIRSVNNVVDVTNYVMIERGQPLHAFDAGKIEGKKIMIRRARAGEKLLTLDGEERVLALADLVIADGSGPIAIAGVMGGKGSEVHDGTETIALESAFFDPITVRRTAKRLLLQTESSYRFERRVDPEGVVPALHRAVSLILELAGGGAAGDFVDLSQKFSRRTISFKPQQVSDLLGGKWKESEITASLKKVGCRKRGNGWEVSSYRGDLTGPADLIEEVVRLAGLDRVPLTFPPLTAAPRSAVEMKLPEAVRQDLVQSGLSEAIHFSFISPKELELFDPSLVGVPILNPLSQEEALLRPSLLPSLLKTAALHHSHKIFDVRLFEFRKIFRKGKKGIDENLSLAGILSGTRLLSHWSLPKGSTDLYDVKGVVDRLFISLGFKGLEALEAVVNGEEIVHIGSIHPDVADRFGLKRPTFFFEIDWERLVSRLSGQRSYRPFSRFPQVERDLSLVVKEEIPGGEIRQTIARIDSRIRGVEIFDLYRGPGLPEGSCSLSFSLKIGREDRTLTDEETNEIMGRVVETLASRFGVQIR